MLQTQCSSVRNPFLLYRIAAPTDRIAQITGTGVTRRWSRYDHTPKTKRQEL